MSDATGRMLPSERLDVDVEVLINGSWWPGVLEHRRQTDDARWEGFVRWSTGPGQNRIGWYPYDQLREVTASESPDDPDAGHHAREPTFRPRP